MTPTSINEIVKYKNPLADEINVTYTVVKIELLQNWCTIMANVNMNIKPTHTANISDLILA